MYSYEDIAGILIDYGSVIDKEHLILLPGGDKEKKIAMAYGLLLDIKDFKEKLEKSPEEGAMILELLELERQDKPHRKLSELEKRCWNVVEGREEVSCSKTKSGDQ